MFNKSYIGNSKYKWFKERLTENFKIEKDGKPKVIFGFNGAGKTTIYKIIKTFEEEKYDFFNHEDLKNSIANQKTLIIMPNIVEIKKIKDEIDEKQNEINIKDIIKKELELGRKTQREKLYANYVNKEVTDKFERSYKQGKFEGFYNENNNDKIKSIIENLNTITPKIYLEIRQELDQIDEVRKEIIKNEKHLLSIALSYLKELDLKENKCPVCDNEVENIREEIEKKLKELEGYQSQLILKLKENNIKEVNDEMIEKIINAHNSLKDNVELLYNYLICNGSLEKYDEISKIYEEIKNKKEKLKHLESEAEKAFQNVLKYKKQLIRDLNKYFQLEKENIKFEDSKITIEFNRKVQEYSTGENNLIMFLYKMYSFIGSDNEYMILDDPMSSLDLINQYKIAYEIVSKSGDKKTLIILTHSVDLVNIINSQHPSKFEYYYIEEIEGKLHLLKIEINNNSNPNVIDINKLKPINNYENLIEILKGRDDNNDSDCQKLFHWTVSEVKDNENTFSNHDLAKLIDKFEKFKLEDFYKNSFVKILYIIALRIWIEKELYNLIEVKNYKEPFLNEKSISNKINYLLPINGKNKINIKENNLREILMSKKVMLNQNIHYNSQISPFKYAINISFDELKKEIIFLKELFDNIKQKD